jgi:AraC-like DNA-binding protein
MLANKGVTIKEVAYRLGYRHPHDFSRAFRKHSGSLPSHLGAGSVREQTHTIKRLGPPGAKLVVVAPQPCLSCV